jgi:hypothetical protein
VQGNGLASRGRTAVARGDHQGAITQYREPLGIIRGLAAKNPEDVERQAGLVLSLFGTASALGTGKGADGASKKAADTMLDQARTITALLDREGRLGKNRQGWKDELARMLTDNPEADGPLVFAEISVWHFSSRTASARTCL